MDKGYVQNTIFELLSRLGIGYGWSFLVFSLFF